MFSTLHPSLITKEFVLHTRYGKVVISAEYAVLIHACVHELRVRG